MQTVISGKTIHYEEQGSGQPILFIHGWGGTHKSLLPIASHLAGEYRTICLDLPGFGESTNPDPQWGVKEYAQLISTFLHQLGLNDVIYFGHSFGGSLGIYLAATEPSLISQLILCSTAFQRKIIRSRFAGLKKLLPSFIRENGICMRLLYRIFFPRSDGWKYIHLQNNFRIIMKEDLTELLSHIHCPTLILWGEEDTQTPIALTDILRVKIPQAKVEIFEYAKHSLPLLYTEEVAHSITRFLTQKNA